MVTTQKATFYHTANDSSFGIPAPSMVFLNSPSFRIIWTHIVLYVLSINPASNMLGVDDGNKLVVDKGGKMGMDNSDKLVVDDGNKLQQQTGRGCW